MAKYVSLVKQRLGSFLAWKFEHIPRDCNEKADALAVVRYKKVRHLYRVLSPLAHVLLSFCVE